MTSLTIDSLRLELPGLEGQVHRLDPIMRRAIELLAIRLEERSTDAETRAAMTLGSLSIAPEGVDLRRMTDEEAAEAIAASLAESVLDAAPWRRTL